MRTFILALSSLIFSSVILSCESQSKGRIETKFQNYVNNNWGDPKDLIEVISVVETDSFNILSHVNEIEKVSLDSLQKEMLVRAERLLYLAPKLPHQKREEIGKKVLPLIIEVNANLLKDMASYNSKKEEVKRLAANIDSAMSVSRNYIIKARIKQDDEIVVKEYYAMDCFAIDSVIFSYAPIKVSDFPPQTYELVTTMRDFWDIIDKQLTYNEKLLNLIRECELYVQ